MSAVKHKKRYPWQEWFAAGHFTVRRGVDFLGRTDSFLQLVRQRLIGSPWSASIKVSEDGDTVEVTLRPRGTPRPVKTVVPQAIVTHYDVFTS